MQYIILSIKSQENSLILQRFIIFTISSVKNSTTYALEHYIFKKLIFFKKVLTNGFIGVIIQELCLTANNLHH